MSIHTLIAERKSIRAFSEKEIAEHTLLSLFEAARWAPSSMNDQPWRFIIAQRKEQENFDRMLSCLNDANRIWAKQGAALVVVVAKKQHSNGSVNKYAWHDVGLAVGNLSMQATAQGVYMHQMGGFNAEVATKLFSIPDEYEPVSMIVLGYAGDPNSLPEKLKERELMMRERKLLNQLVFGEKFGIPSALIKLTEGN